MRALALSLGLCSLLGCATAPSGTAAAKVTPPPAPSGEQHAGMMKAADDPAGALKTFDHKPKPGEKAICAVSGEAFVVDADTKTAQYGGKYYAFCCDQCAPDFAANPAKYAQ
jgi:hypothetical protein